jgi:peptidoglycan/xylan/chitin deacetylase (PgdA/CDA1 family)
VNSIYTWPNQKKCAVAISFDFDGETPFMWRNRKKDCSGIGEFEQRLFGPRQAIYRILELLNKWDIQATFFIPGYIAEQYPKAIEEIHRNNHEIGLHGYVHERVDELNPDEIEETVTKSMEIFHKLTGITKMGYRSPSWEMTQETFDVLKKHKITYDSSLMGYEHPYWMDGLPEIPVQWILDDAIFYRYTGSGGVSTNPPSNPKQVIDIWKQEFEGIKHYGGLFLLTMHPWISGRGSRLLALEHLFKFLKNDSDIWWATCQDIADHHRANYIGQFQEKTPIISRIT